MKFALALALFILISTSVCQPVINSDDDSLLEKRTKPLGHVIGAKQKSVEVPQWLMHPDPPSDLTPIMLRARINSE
jgi:hypothetical protein